MDLHLSRRNFISAIAALPALFYVPLPKPDTLLFICGSVDITHVLDNIGPVNICHTSGIEPRYMSKYIRRKKNGKLNESLKVGRLSAKQMLHGSIP